MDAVRERVEAALAAAPPAGAPLAVAAGAASACLLLALVDPQTPGRYPTCPFLALTGRWCPGCGALRGTAALLRGDVVAMAGFNPMLVLAVPFLAYSWAAWALPRLGLPGPPALRVPAAGIWSLLVAVLAFWVLRNLPAFAVLAP